MRNTDENSDEERRAALYLRVSTEDQKTANQEAQLRQWAKRLNLKVVEVYSDTMSGARNDRAGLTEVLAAAHRREFDIVLIWSLDRLSREGVLPVLKYLRRFKDAGVRVLSLQESWLDTDGPLGELLVSIFAWMSKQERLKIGERTKAALQRLRASGTVLGRPREITAAQMAAIREHRKHHTIRKVASLVGVGVGTVERVLQASNIRPRRQRWPPSVRQPSSVASRTRDEKEYRVSQPKRSPTMMTNPSTHRRSVVD